VNEFEKMNDTRKKKCRLEGERARMSRQGKKKEHDGGVPKIRSEERGKGVKVKEGETRNASSNHLPAEDGEAGGMNRRELGRKREKRVLFGTERLLSLKRRYSVIEGETWPARGGHKGRIRKTGDAFS